MQMIYVFALLTFFFIAVVSFFVWRGFREEPAFLFWSVSAMVQALGWGMFLQHKVVASSSYESLSETLLFAGHLIGYLAFLVFAHSRIGTRHYLIAGLVVITFLIFDFTARYYATGVWHGVVALSHSTLNLLIMTVIYRQRRPDNSGVVYSSLAMLGVLVAASFLKGFEILLSGDAAPKLSAESTVNSAVIFSASLTVIMGTIILSLLAFTRLARSMRELATRDPLTKALNRRAWDVALDREIKRSQRSGAVFSIVMLDFDHFKVINDRYGHAGGDEALMTISHVIQSQLRTVDVLSRHGGEEFLILLSGTPLVSAANTAERLRLQVVATPIHHERETFSITCSAGVAEFAIASDTPDTLMERADRAMYRAKNNGRNQVAMERHEVTTVGRGMHAI